jgi:hypothetical protein
MNRSEFTFQGLGSTVLVPDSGTSEPAPQNQHPEPNPWNLNPEPQRKALRFDLIIDASEM